MVSFWKERTSLPNFNKVTKRESILPDRPTVYPDKLGHFEKIAPVNPGIGTMRSFILLWTTMTFPPDMFSALASQDVLFMLESIICKGAVPLTVDWEKTSMTWEGSYEYP